MATALPPTGAPPAPRGPSARRYGVAIACTLAFAALRLALEPALPGQAPLLALLGAPLLASWFGGWGPGVLATFLSALVGETVFTPPLVSLLPQGLSDWVPLALFVAYGLFFSALNEGRLRRLREAAARQDHLLRAQQALALREQRMRETLEASPAGMIVVNRDGRIELVNGQAERLFGITRDRLLGRQVNTVVPEAQHACHALHHQRFACTHEEVAYRADTGCTG